MQVPASDAFLGPFVMPAGVASCAMPEFDGANQPIELDSGLHANDDAQACFLLNG
jgi:hypothetical protein